MALEEKVALEVLKPAGGFISALIAPKVEKVRKWAEGRELKSQLDPDILAYILDKYLNTLASRVSVISSICFPQKEFPIENAYEPLFLEEHHNGFLEEYHNGFRDSEQISVDSIVNNLSQSCLIVDGAGMGKSTFSKYLTTQILYKSDRIPILFELRKSKSDIDLVESMAKELDPIGKFFSRELFYELIQNGKFLIILDGFDEVEIERQSEVAEKINEFSTKGKENTLFLTTRPQELIPNILNAKSYRFSTFTVEQAKSLVERLDSISGLDIGKRLIDEFPSVPSDFLNNPLLVSLLYTTFGSTNSIADRICTFYNDIYHALYKGHDLINKNGFEREKLSGLDYEQFRVLLRALCFQMVLKRKTSFQSPIEAFEYIHNSAQLSKVELKSPNSYFNDLLNSVPLLQKDGSDYKFLHKTIVEYFAAEYIVYRADSEDILRRMFLSKSFNAFEKIFDFVFELSVDTYDSVVTTYHAENIINNLDLSSEYKSVMSTAAYVSELVVGVVPVDGNYIQEGMAENPPATRLQPSHEVVFSQGDVRSWTWFDFDYDDKSWFLIVTEPRIRKHNHIHEKAWFQLTSKKYIPDIDDVIKGEDFSLLVETIGFDNWVSIDSNIINKLANNEFAYRLFGRFLGYGFILDVDGDSERVLSPSKIQLFLDGMRAKKEIEDELAELLFPR